LADSSASELYVPAFQKLCSVFTWPMKMEQCSDISAYKIQMLGNHSREIILHSQQGESLKSKFCYIPTVQTTRCPCYLKLFILVKCSTCFGLSFRPSSGAQNCVHSNGICQTAAATCCYQECDEFHLMSSWWWMERPSETCRAFYKNK